MFDNSCCPGTLAPGLGRVGSKIAVCRHHREKKYICFENGNNAEADDSQHRDPPLQPLCRIAWLRFRSSASSKKVDPSITPPPQSCSITNATDNALANFFLRRERESGVTAIRWQPSAIGSGYRRSITTTVPVTALSVLRPCSKVTKVNLGIDYRPHVRWRFSKKHFPYFCSGIQCIVITIEVSAQIWMRSACCVS